MPAPLRFYLALLGGIVAGFTTADAAAVVRCGVLVSALAIGVAAVRTHRTTSVLATAAVLGCASAWCTRAADASCRATLIASGAFDGVVDDDARPGTSVRGTAVDACRLRVSLRVRGGNAAAGDVVHVRGAAWPTDRGLRVPEATIVATGDRDGVIALRHAAGHRIDALFGLDAPLVRALVIADAASIPDDVRDRFADAGLVHALSVSGLHVAIVAGALELALLAARLSHARATLVALLVVAAYVVLIGAPAAAVRAGAMLVLAGLTRLGQRPTSPWTGFAFGAMAPLVDPRVALDLGYQLSVSGMAALVATRACLRQARMAAQVARTLPTRPAGGEVRRSADRAAAVASVLSARGWRGALAREAFVGVVATVVTAPLVAWHFGRLSVAGVVSNLAAGPILALLQPALFLALVLSWCAPIASLAAAASHPLLVAFDTVARVAGELPGAVVTVTPSGFETGASIVGSFALLAALAAARHRGRALLVATSMTMVVAWGYAAPTGSGQLELHMLDVGQGDALALRTPRGRWVLFDAGNGGHGVPDAGARVVVPYVRRRGGTVAALVLSHPHADHVGGAPTVIRRLHPGVIWDAGFALGSSTYHDVLASARAAGARWHRVRPADTLVVDGVVLTAVAPDSAWTASLDDPNLSSVVVSVRYGAVRFLLTGDAEAPEEDWLVARASRDPATAELLAADVLKVAHHGSRTSSTEAFVRLVHPRVALVSVGAANMYHHPSMSVVDRLQSHGARVFRTDADGAVVVRTDGRRVEVESHETRWPVPATERSQ